MRTILRFIFDNYEQIIPILIIGSWFGICFVYLGIGRTLIVHALFFILASVVFVPYIRGGLVVWNSISYGFRWLKAYAYRKSAPEWQGFLCS
jgi:hypothetical protein